MNQGYALTTWLRIRWEKGTRYYEAYVHQDLWGDWVLTRIWGRRETRLGRVVCLPCQSYREAGDRARAEGGSTEAMPSCRQNPRRTPTDDMISYHFNHQREAR